MTAVKWSHASLDRKWGLLNDLALSGKRTLRRKPEDDPDDIANRPRDTLADPDVVEVPGDAPEAARRTITCDGPYEEVPALDPASSRALAVIVRSPVAVDVPDEEPTSARAIDAAPVAEQSPTALPERARFEATDPEVDEVPDEEAESLRAMRAAPEVDEAPEDAPESLRESTTRPDVVELPDEDPARDRDTDAVPEGAEAPAELPVNPRVIVIPSDAMVALPYRR